MAIKEVLLLGNPRLYEISTAIERQELEEMKSVVDDLHDTLLDFRRKFGAGRAVAAPQIGVMKRLIYMNIDRPVVFINPSLSHKSEERIEVWDDCLCFPDLLVKVKRFKRCRIAFCDLNWNKGYLDLEDDLSELLQHEYDHLDGILAVERSIDGKSFALRSQRKWLA